MKEMKAVVDRISEGNIVMLIKDSERQIIVDKGNLKLNEGDWVDLKIDDYGNIKSITNDYELTESKREKISEIMDRVKSKKGSKFKK